jgi:parallel beta-helix repeat protein
MIDDGIVIDGTSFEHWNTHKINISNTVNGKQVYYWKNRTSETIPPGAGQVFLVNCSEINIENQELTESSAGIEIAYSANINITDNNISNNNWYSIYAYSSDKINMTNNKILSNWEGIRFYFSNKNIILNNNLSSNNWFGISAGYSDSNLISRNKINDNTFGIVFGEANLNNITFNSIYNWWMGLSLSSSSNNTFHHNNIMNNVNQIELDNTTCFDNVWNDTNGEGNYWGDYTGLDDGSGGRIKGDGIGDTEIPHPVVDQGDGYHQLDNCPLMYPIGKFIFLYRGWNLISLPYIQPDIFIGSVLKSIDGSYDALQWYNSTDFIDHWKHNNSQKPFKLNDLDRIDHTMGIWIHITAPNGVMFHYPGSQPVENQTINIYPGWNLIGFPSLTSHNRTEGLNNLIFGSDIDSIWTYKANIQTWKEITELDYFEVGRGYWVHSNVTKVLEVPL